MLDLLRQLALGLSSYRLFPEDPEQPGYVAAVERIRETAGQALALDARHAEVRSGRFRDGDGAVVADEYVDRLAAACFERGVEFLVIRQVPSRDDLRATLRALSMTAPEVAEAGGVGAILQRAGVVSLRLGDVAPEGDPDLEHALEHLSAEQLDVWRTVLDPERFVANLLIEGLPRDRATAAQGIYRRFETVRAILPVSLTAKPEFVQNLIRVVDALPASVQREFGAHAITRARAGDDLASDYLGSMTDPELASVLVDMQVNEGPDASTVAQELVERVGRQPGIVDVAMALLEARGLTASPGDPDSLVALSDGAITPGDSLARTAAIDLFASRLLEATDRDITVLQESYPDSPERLRQAALNTFRDYLVNEHDIERLGQALETWGGHLRDALTSGDDAVTSELFDVTEGAYSALAGDDRRRLVDVARRRILDAELLGGLAHRAKVDTEIPAVVAMLRRFGHVAQDALLDALADEENRGTRAVLVSMIVEVAGDEVDTVVERLSDDRWFVVRNGVTILGRLPDRAGFRHLTVLADHPYPQVRRELVRALVAAGGSDAVPYLERLAQDEDEGVQSSAITALGSLVAAPAAQALGRVVAADVGPAESRRALDALRRHADPAATEVLSGLASRGHRPRLPRAIRRYAKGCLGQRRRAS